MMSSLKMSRVFLLVLLSSASWMHAKKVTISSVDEFKQLLASKGPVVVKFSADAWCGACKAIKPDFDEIANSPEFEHITFAYVDADTNRDVMSQQGITGLPTFLFLEDGKIVDKEVGAKGGKAGFANYLRRKLATLKVASIDTNVETKGSKVVTEETTLNPITGTQTATKDVTKETTKGDETKVKQETTTTTQPVSTEGMSFFDKIQALFVSFFTGIKNFLMSIVNWFKGLFGK